MQASSQSPAQRRPQTRRKVAGSARAQEGLARRMTQAMHESRCRESTAASRAAAGGLDQPQLSACATGPDASALLGRILCSSATPVLISILCSRSIELARELTLDQYPVQLPC
jgi:hypothetical protein